MESYKNPLFETSRISETDIWNDSCALEELTYAIENGAVGATTNPVIVGNVLNQEIHLWKDRIYELISELKTGSEEDIAWKLNEEMAIKGAAMLEPVFYKEKGLKGRISIQVNPKNYRNAQLMTDQAVYFNSLAPNMNIKLPATAAGIAAMEEATYRGVSINATVSFTVPQVIAAAEAVERGLARREAEGMDTKTMSPLCVVMVGRTDDWLKIVAQKEGIIVNPAYLEWAGVAVFKKAYKIFKERGYRSRLLAAAYRNHLHWSEFIGGDVSLTIPYKWQKRFNNSDIEVKPGMDNPVSKEIIDGLSDKFEDFKKAYNTDGLKIDEFDEYGATVRTLRSFIAGYEHLLGIIRDFMIPDPDIA